MGPDCVTCFELRVTGLSISDLRFGIADWKEIDCGVRGDNQINPKSEIERIRNL